ncbi:hypothetical protein V8E53_009849 [Lactarius tabidus]
MQHCIKFLAYDEVSNLLMSTRAKETNLRRFSPGAISDAISVFFTYPSSCFPPPAFPNDHPSSNQRALSTLKAAALRRIRRDLFHTLQLPKCCRGFRLLCQPRRHRTLRMGRFLTWDYLHAATPVTVSVSSDLQAALNSRLAQQRLPSCLRRCYTPTPQAKPPPSLSSTIAGPTSPAIELIRETIYAAHADVLTSTPHLHAQLTHDPPRAYYGPVALSILAISARSVSADDSDAEAVWPVRRRRLTVAECLVLLLLLMPEFVAIGKD